MAHIRTYEELEKFGPTAAEQKLIHACKHGDECVLGDGELPPAPEDGADPDPAHEIRAAILRYLLLGGCKTFQTDDVGVMLAGAHITSTLDLNFTTLRGPMRLPNCRFAQRLYMMQTQVALLHLDGSLLNGLRAQGLNCKGNIYLRKVTCTDTVDMIGVEVGGSLEFGGAELTPKEGMALCAQDTRVTGSVFLRGMTATGTVDVNGAEIGGSLDFEGAELTPKEDKALHAQGIAVHGGLFWRKMTAPTGLCDFTDAHFQSLADDPSCWPNAENLIFDGMTYERLSGGAPTDARTRLGWLKRGSFWKDDFRPQPHTQLAKVLREMGHDADARKILAERERLLHQEARKNFPLPRKAFHCVREQVFLRFLIGYGHKPFNSVWAILFLILIAIVPSHYAYEAGDFAPNSAVIQTSDGWQAALSEDNPAKAWSEKDKAGQDWETFNRYAYGFDVVIPIINFGQTEAWAPSTTRGGWGWHLWWLKWVLSTAGWIVTALGAAAITGLIRRD